MGGEGGKRVGAGTRNRLRSGGGERVVAIDPPQLRLFPALPVARRLLHRRHRRWLPQLGVAWGHEDVVRAHGTCGHGVRELGAGQRVQEAFAGAQAAVVVGKLVGGRRLHVGSLAGQSGGSMANGYNVPRS